MINLRDIKRVILLATLLVATLSSLAQNADAVTLATAPRTELNLPKGAYGYTVTRVNLFGSSQTISELMPYFGI